MGARPLSEGQLAEVGYTMRLCTKADIALQKAMANLEHCKVSIDADSMKHVSHYLQEIHDKMNRQVLSHIDAVQAARK